MAEKATAAVSPATAAAAAEASVSATSKAAADVAVPAVTVVPEVTKPDAAASTPEATAAADMSASAASAPASAAATAVGSTEAAEAAAPTASSATPQGNGAVDKASRLSPSSAAPVASPADAAEQKEDSSAVEEHEAEWHPDEEQGELMVQRPVVEGQEIVEKTGSMAFLPAIAALVSFAGILSYSGVVLYQIFRGKRKGQKKGNANSQNQHVEDLEMAFDLPEVIVAEEKKPVTRRVVQVQEDVEEANGWDNDGLSDGGWGDDAGWDNFSDSEDRPSCKTMDFDADLMEAAITSGMMGAHSPVGVIAKGKAD